MMRARPEVQSRGQDAGVVLTVYAEFQLVLVTYSPDDEQCDRTYGTVDATTMTYLRCKRNFFSQFTNVPVT